MKNKDGRLDSLMHNHQLIEAIMFTGWNLLDKTNLFTSILNLAQYDGQLMLIDVIVDLLKELTPDEEKKSWLEPAREYVDTCSYATHKHIMKLLEEHKNTLVENEGGGDE